MSMGVSGVRDKTVLLTGGAGLIGSHIADELVRAGAREIRVYDKLVRGRRENLAWALENGPVTIIEGDIGDRRFLAEAVEDVDVVFHQAAIRITQCAEEPRLAFEVMVEGTFNLFEAAASAGVRKVVVASSASVYGLADAFPTPETQHPYGNRTMYGAAKVFGEGLARTFHEMYGLDYVALRYFNVYGPRMDIRGPHTEVLIRWIERIANGEPPLILGDGTQTADFIYVGDIARANILAATSSISDEILNVGTGVETSLDGLARALLKVMDSGLEPEYGPERTVNAVSRRLADTSRAHRILGFEAHTELDEGLRRLVEWWREETTGEPARAAVRAD